MQITSSTASSSLETVYQNTATSQQSQTTPTQSDSVSISPQAIQQAEQANLQTPEERISPTPTPYP